MTESEFPKTMWTPDGATTIECHNQAEVDACVRGGWLPGDPKAGPEPQGTEKSDPATPKRKHR